MKHRIVTAAQMKEIERAGDAHGLPYLQMMENAGLAAYAELQKQFPHPGRLLVICGKGNNGGDGFVIARAAAKDGWSVTVLLAEGEPKTADAILNFERLHSLPVHICTDCSVLETQSFAAVVDALYGTGFHGELRPSGLAACGLMRRLHKSGAFVLAVDLPSGINTDTGDEVYGDTKGRTEGLDKGWTEPGDFTGLKGSQRSPVLSPAKGAFHCGGLRSISGIFREISRRLPQSDEAKGSPQQSD